MHKTFLTLFCLLAFLVSADAHNSLAAIRSLTNRRPHPYRTH